MNANAHTALGQLLLALLLLLLRCPPGASGGA